MHEKCFALKFFLGATASEHGLRVVQDGARGAVFKDGCLRGDLGTMPCLSYSNSDPCPIPANDHSRGCQTFGGCLGKS